MPTIETLNETFESKELFRRAEIGIQRRNYEKALELLAEALKIAPENPIYLSHYGLCVGMLGDCSVGEKICRKAIDLSPSLPILIVNLGRILLERGDRQGAREQFMEAYKIDNTSAAAALELSSMGVRRQPIIPFLDRSHPLNYFLGKLRYRILCLRKPAWKKL